MTCGWLQQRPETAKAHTAEGKTVPPHTHTLDSVYAGAAGVTFAASFFAGRIDHIFHSAPSQTSVEARLPLCSDTSRQLPDVATPSDHFPIGATLSLAPLPASAAAPSDAAAVARQAAAETAADEAAWHAVEPLWRALHASAPAPAKGPPSDEALRRLRAHAKEKKALLAMTPPRMHARAKALAALVKR